MEAVGAAEDVFYEEEEEVVNCYDFEPLPTLLEDEVSEAGAGTEPPPPLPSPVVGRPAGSRSPAPHSARAVRAARRLRRAPEIAGARGLARPAGSGQVVSTEPFPSPVFTGGSAPSPAR